MEKQMQSTICQNCSDKPIIACINIYSYVNQTHTWYTHLHTLFLLMFCRNAFLQNKEFNNSQLLWEICTYKSTCKIGCRWSKESKFLVGAVGERYLQAYHQNRVLKQKIKGFTCFTNFRAGSASSRRTGNGFLGDEKPHPKGQKYPPMIREVSLADSANGFNFLGFWGLYI